VSPGLWEQEVVNLNLARLLGAALVACGLWTAVVPIAALSGRQEQAHQHMALMR